MEEVDAILFLSLRSVGSPLGEGIRSVADFGADLLVECAARCLRSAAPDTVWPLALPKAMSARFRMCTNMAKRVQAMGYQGEVGYHQFLYPNEAEARALLLFLVEKLPKGQSKEEAADAQPLTARERADRAVSLFSSGGWIPRVLSRRSDRFGGLRSAPDSHACGDPCDTRTDLPWSQPTVSHVLSDGEHAAVRGARQGGSSSTGRPPSSPMATVTSQCAVRSSAAGAVAAIEERRSAMEQWSAASYGAGKTADQIASLRRDRCKALSSGPVRSAFASGLSEAAALGGAVGTSGGSYGGYGTLDTLLGPGATSWSSSMNLGAGGAFANAVAFSQERGSAGGVHVRTEADARAEAEAEQRRMDAEIEDARAKIMDLSGKIEAAERETQAALAEARQKGQDAGAERIRRAELEAAYTAKKATIDMLSDVDGNARQLKELADGSRQRLVELALEWEKRRVPILEAIRAQRDGLRRRREDCDKKLQEIKDMRAEMKSMIQQAREREETVKQATAEYERMPKDVSRALYTRRILDIVKNVKKQDAEIQKILADTRTVHKDINTAAEAMARAYATCDEAVFKKASQDVNAKPAYKAVVELHSAFERLAKLTEESGQLGNNSRDTQRRIDQVAARNDGNNEERVAADLKQIKVENAALLKRLKAQRKEE